MDYCCTFAAVKIVRTTILPFKGFTAINLLGMLFVHPGVYLSDELMNHEISIADINLMRDIVLSKNEV